MEEGDNEEAEAKDEVPLDIDSILQKSEEMVSSYYSLSLLSPSSPSYGDKCGFQFLLI